MARPARGADNLEWAREVLARAQTVEQLRQAQTVVLPLDYGLSLEQTARITRWAKTPEHERRSRARGAGPVPGSCQRGRHPGGGPGQGRTGGPLGAAHGAVLGLQPAAPSRLAQAGSGQAPPSERSAGSRGLEKNSPADSPSSERSGPSKRRPS